MTSYNGFTPAQRWRGLAIVKRAIADGVIPPANTLPCSRCGQTEGIIMYHSEDYTPERIVAQVVPLCWRCHMMLHCRFRHPKSWEKYAAEVAAGTRYPPVYRHSWPILNQHFID